MLQYLLGDFMKDVYKFLDSLNISKEEPLVVAVSYGPDSMFLLSLLKLKFKNNKIICCHVHHNHRAESDREAEELEKYCKENNIIFEFMKIDKYKNDKFTEEEARDIRYKFFSKITKKYHSKYLFTAHHGDDLIETIMMRLTRGSSISGYSAIQLISDRKDYKLIRPLLYLTKDEIISLCNSKKIPYAVDNTNFSDDQMRNRFRNNILPFLKKENAKVHEKFLMFSCMLKEYDDYINNIVCKTYQSIVKNNRININLLKKEDKLIIKKVIEKYLYNTYKENIKLINKNHTELIFNLIFSGKSNACISLPLNKKIIKSYDLIYIDKDNKYNSYCFLFDDYLKLPNNYVIKKINNVENNSNYITLLDSSSIKLPLYVRNRVSGDKISVLNMDGTRKLKDIFIDEKIDKYEREIYPVVVDSLGNIVWLPGLKKTKYDRSKEGKYDIILKYCKED